MASEKFETSWSRLESTQDVTDDLTTILSMDWQAFTWKSNVERTSLLVFGYPKPKETPKDENQLSFSDVLENLGEQSWTSPPSSD